MNSKAVNFKTKTYIKELQGSGQKFASPLYSLNRGRIQEFAIDD